MGNLNNGALERNDSRRVALVTGGSRGIGRACAVGLAEDGFDIAVIYAGSVDAARETCDACEAAGATARSYQCDVADPAAVNACVEAVLNDFGSIWALVNNAGITADKLLLRMTEADFDNVLATNLKGAFFCTKAACRFMMHQRYGRIISVSSVVGLHGNAGQANYAASKAGLIGLTKSVAKEYAARNITANAVAPGFIETDMTAAMPESARAAAAACAHSAAVRGKPSNAGLQVDRHEVGECHRANHFFIADVQFFCILHNGQRSRHSLIAAAGNDDDRQGAAVHTRVAARSRHGSGADFHIIAVGFEQYLADVRAPTAR